MPIGVIRISLKTDKGFSTEEVCIVADETKTQVNEEEIITVGPETVEELTECQGGEFTRAIAFFPVAPYQMTVRSAQGVGTSQEVLRRALKCRPDVTSATYYLDGSVFICAPYLVCNAI
jgi:hypothetical protein